MGFDANYIYSFKDIKDLDKALTFDDIVLRPDFSELQEDECDISARISDKINLNLPFISSPMDDVTGARMAKEMARNGALGIIHRRNTIEDQVKEVIDVKRSESWIVENPKSIDVSMPVTEAQKLILDKRYSGLPVFDDGTLKGIVTMRDLPEFRKPVGIVKDIMTTDLKIVSPDISEDKAIELMYENRLEKLLVVEDDKFLGMIVKKDIRKRRVLYPNGIRDDKKRLLVGAAVAINNYKRAEALVNAEVDVLVIDFANGGHEDVVRFTKEMRSKYEDLTIVSGNVATYDAALDLFEAGADCIRVGIGPGSICTTRLITGVGVSQITAVYEARCAALDYGQKTGKKVYIIADGGLRYSGDVVKALAAGADVGMMGGYFAGAEETPGEAYFQMGKYVKRYRGMGSEDAIKEGSNRYGDANKKHIVSEGVVGQVEYKGPIAGILMDVAGGLKAAMTKYEGVKNLEDLKWTPKFSIQSIAGLNESHPHDIEITKQASNYQGR
jgi:IMP dehydrogenase